MGGLPAFIKSKTPKKCSLRGDILRNLNQGFVMKTTTNNTIPALLDYRTLEQFYGLKKSTISKLVMLGKFTNIVKIGTKNFFRREDVEAWLDKQTISVGA